MDNNKSKRGSLERGGFTISFVVPLLFVGSQTYADGPILPTFLDITSRARVTFHNEASHTSDKYLLETMGGGVAIFDYDRDGYMDLFFVNGAKLEDPMPAGNSADKSDSRYWNRLYRNKKDGSFIDVTEDTGLQGHSYGMGVVVGDYDNDHWPDLFITNYGRDILYHNEGDGTFTDVTERAGVAGSGWSTAAAFVDYDRDGHLDLIVIRYLIWDYSKNIWCGKRLPGYRNYCHPDHFLPVPHLVYHNNGDGTFSEASKNSGFSAPGKGLGVAINDFDDDGWPDVFIANDSFPQQLFRNSGDRSFEEVGLIQGASHDEHGRVFAGMGVDFSDYDNDGRPDVFVTALAHQGYALFHNQEGSFAYVSDRSGVSRATRIRSGWGTKFIDYDNDGWKDLLVGQGHVMENIELTQPDVRYLEPLLLMKNVEGKFEDVSERSGAPFRVPMAARGVAFGDLNNDGFLDVAINRNNEPAVILENQGGNENHWLLISTVGKTSNRDGMGTKIHLVSESGLEQHAYISTAGSYMSSNDKRAHFGLGRDKKVRLLKIMWPSGIMQRLENVTADQVLTVEEPEQVPNSTQTAVPLLLHPEK